MAKPRSSEKKADEGQLRALLKFPAVVWVIWIYIAVFLRSLESLAYPGYGAMKNDILQKATNLFVDYSMKQFFNAYMPSATMVLALGLLLWIGWRARVKYGLDARESARVGAIAGSLGILVTMLPFLLLFLLMSLAFGGVNWVVSYALANALPLVIAVVIWAINGAILSALGSLAAEYKKKWA